MRVVVVAMMGLTTVVCKEGLKTGDNMMNRGWHPRWKAVTEKRAGGRFLISEAPLGVSGEPRVHQSGFPVSGVGPKARARTFFVV